MVISIFLAKVLGLYLVVVTLAVLYNSRQYDRLVSELSSNLPLIIFSGFVSLVIGLLVVVGHSVWTPDWRGLITLLGWLSVIKGLVRLFFPERVGGIGRWLGRNTTFRTAVMIVFLVLGVYLTYVGFAMGSAY